jgi:hypothetical protein
MASLKRLAAAIRSGEVSAMNHSALIYGPPKSGKTRLVGTAAELKEVTKIWWFDLENGAETLLHMDLSEEALDKVEYIKVADTKDTPWAIETMLKALTSKEGVWISASAGRVVSVKDKVDGDIFFKLSDCTGTELIVVDSATQLGASALNATMMGKAHTVKPTFDEYGLMGKWLGDIMSVIQQAANTNFVVITHETMMEDNDGRTKFFPICGTMKFSMSLAKYFGTVVYTSMKMKKHTAGSGTDYANDKLTGSRLGVAMERATELSMKALLIDGGILGGKRVG